MPVKTDYVSINGKRLRQYRRERGMTQWELGRRLGYKTPYTINQAEIAYPGAAKIARDKLLALAEALNVKADELLL